jgi:hypothetical protein
MTFIDFLQLHSLTALGSVILAAACAWYLADRL